MSRQSDPAELAPSRFLYALPKLAGYLITRNREPGPRFEGDGMTLLNFQQEQSRFETFGLLAWFAAAWTLLLAALIRHFQLVSGWGAWALALSLVFLSGWFMWPVVGMFLHLLRQIRIPLTPEPRIQRCLHHLLFSGLAAFLLFDGDVLVRWVARAWYVMLLLNALAALLLRAIRHRVDQVDSRLRGPVFDAQFSDF